MTDSLDAVRAAIAPVTAAFVDADEKLYLVGGVVRDLYLGRLRSNEADIDLTTAARPERIKALVSPVVDDVWTQGERFGTIGCRVGECTVEITTHRADAYDEASRKPLVEFGDNLHDDLARRDFTANAMAIDVTDPAAPIIDPFGGRADLDSGVLRTPSAPDVSFSDDPLRMMRAARFLAGYDLQPVPEMVASVGSNIDRFEIVSRERVRDEFEKLICLDNPGRGLDFLDASGLMDRVVGRGAGVPMAELERRLKALPPLPALRWAAVVVDRSAWQAPLRDLRLSNALTAEVGRLVVAVAKVRALESIDGPSIRRLAVDGVRRDDIDSFVRSINESAPTPNGPTVGEVVDAWDQLAANEDVSALGSPLDGDEIQQTLGIKPGRRIGEAKAMLTEASIDRGPLTKAEAVELLQVWRPPSGTEPTGSDDDGVGQE